ncbi:MAG: hypothetical protein ACRD96_24245, partial [Bryobacteraceae bacterium]
MPTRLVSSSSAAARLTAAREHIGAHASAEVLIVASSRAAADELAAEIAFERGGLFGVARAGFVELITRLALPALAKAGLSPTGGLGAEAVATRVAFEAKSGALTYFSPVAGMPGFPRAAARTLDELQQAAVNRELLAHVEDVGSDLATLLERVEHEHARSATVTRAALIGAAARSLESARLPHLVLLDVAVGSKAERDVLHALVSSSESLFATAPTGDARTLAVWKELGFEPSSLPAPPALPALPARLRLQQNLFSAELPAAGFA